MNLHFDRGVDHVLQNSLPLLLREPLELFVELALEPARFQLEDWGVAPSEDLGELLLELLINSRFLRLAESRSPCAAASRSW